MKILLATIMTWLSVNFGLPENFDFPSIVHLTASPMVAALELRSGRQVVASYDDATRTIFLPETWTGETPAELSILVHEMVHHLQNVGGKSYPCPAAREKLAYAAQDAWLRLFGSDLASAFELDAMTLKLTTNCLPY
jgi:hypothetical protein